MSSVRPGDDQLPRAGDVIAGKYRVESVIGAGGMGVVLGAQDTSLGRKVAIKFLAPSKASNEAAAARFVREARAAASIQSEHVVRVFEVGTLPNGASYIVMEHLAGADLSHVLESRGPLAVPDAVDYLLQACEAIGEAHGRGIVHRDLKPQNLFLATGPDGSPSVKVLDFGISKVLDEGPVSLTSTDMVMGTPLYMSPEQVRSLKSVDLRADIWALGAILFELLTSRPVFEATTMSALCAMIAMDPPPPLRERAPHAPAGLEAVILRCLHKDPQGRFQDVAAFADALAPFASERGRSSVARIARVVRGSTNLPPVAVAGHGYTGHAQQPQHPQHTRHPQHTQHTQHAQHPQRSTNESWQHPTGGGPNAVAPRTSSSALLAILGGLAGILLLASLGGAGLYVRSRRTDAEAVKLAVADSGGAAAATEADAAIATVAATASTTSTPVAVTAPKKGALPAAKDAGSGAPADAGVAPSGVTPPEEERQRNERLKQIAEARCAHQRFQLSRNDATNSGAKTVQLQTCLQAQSLSPNSGSSNCERSNCRTACTILKDQICLQRLEMAERGNPLKF